MTRCRLVPLTTSDNKGQFMNTARNEKRQGKNLERAKSEESYAKFSKWESLELQGPLVLDILRAQRPKLMPEIQDCNYDNGNAQANGEEEPVSGKQDQQSDNSADSDDEAGTAFDRRQGHMGSIVATCVDSG